MLNRSDDKINAVFYRIHLKLVSVWQIFLADTDYEISEAMIASHKQSSKEPVIYCSFRFFTPPLELLHYFGC